MNVRELREKKGIRQCELAAIVGLSAPALSMIETGQVLPTQETAKKLILALDSPTVDNHTTKPQIFLKTEMRALKRGINIHGRLKWEFDPSIFKKAGYMNMNHWINDCYALLKMEVEDDTTDNDV